MCRRVYCSFGIAVAFFPNLTRKEQHSLVVLNKFWYKSAVSRVMVRIALSPLFHFQAQYGEAEVEIIGEEKRQVLKARRSHLNHRNWYSCVVGAHIFQVLESFQE